MDFARKQLEKYGWKDGKGLGRNEDGISEAIKPKLKFDNAGVGHSVGTQFTDNWWERVFNNAARNINVKLDKDQVKLELGDVPIEISTKNYSLRELKKNANLEYGSFLKTEKLTGAGSESYDVATPEPLMTFTGLTDEELFEACGGRTAHKGARHGLKLNGKLSRIEKQEKMLLKKMRNVSLSDDTSNLEKKIKKLKKHKEESVAPKVETVELASPSTKKPKNKRKSVSFNEETVVKYYTPDLDTSGESARDENGNSSVACDEGIEQDIDESGTEFNDNHRSFEEAQTTFDDLSKAERRKLKKKRKLEKKKTATALFIEEVREQMNDENGKKRKLVNEDNDGKQSPIKKCSKKSRFFPEKVEMLKLEKREKKLMKNIVKSLDFCKISDNN